MGLYERLLGTEEPKIHVHAFMAALGEIERGGMTAQQGIDAFGLDAGEQAEASTLIARIVTPKESISLGGFVTLTNVGNAYVSNYAARGLGVVRLECAGISAFEFGVSVNKIGSGTQSWQLWDETNSLEVAVIDDDGAAGNKQLATTQTFGSPLAAGIRTLRVRVKSTTAQDDPIYYGASLIVQRVGKMTSDVLHEVLLLAEVRIAPLNTVVAVKARLGV
jgi:hypothetical protein